MAEHDPYDRRLQNYDEQRNRVLIALVAALAILALLFLFWPRSDSPRATGERTSPTVTQSPAANPQTPN
jgi:hypothetical protein